MDMCVFWCGLAVWGPVILPPLLLQTDGLVCTVSQVFWAMEMNQCKGCWEVSLVTAPGTFTYIGPPWGDRIPGVKMLDVH